MTTSLGLASQGLLSRGGKPSLHIASLGHLREIEVITQPGGGGGYIRPLRMPELEQTEDSKRRKLLFVLLLTE